MPIFTEFPVGTVVSINNPVLGPATSIGVVPVGQSNCDDYVFDNVG